MPKKVYEIKTPVKVYIEYTGEVPNAEVITYVIQSKKLFGGFKHKIHQIIPYIKNADMHQRGGCNKLLKTIAKRDYGVAKMYIRDNFFYIFATDLNTKK